MTGPGPSLLRRVFRPLGHVAARVYLVACVLLFGWALLAASEGSMALVIPLLAIVPSGLVLLLVLPEGTATFGLSVVFGVLINAMLIGWCARALRRGNNPDTAA
ncbi:SCO4225 family membrane protein [Streptomyces sp. NPDC005551]|uniref:SCO4225 family membrane protein n=1 Tax=unclassified Streptomyces TaxID=2593676 RepID=UPI0033C80A8F